MEFTKDIILNLNFRRLNVFNYKLRNILNKVFSFIKKCTSNFLTFVKNNKFICITLTTLIVLISADMILINIFIKLFSTLY